MAFGVGCLASSAAFICSSSDSERLSAQRSEAFSIGSRRAAMTSRCASTALRYGSVCFTVGLVVIAWGSITLLSSVELKQ